MLGPGTVVDAKYRLERVLGRGGMGMVIEARHLQLGTPVALKFLHKGVMENASGTERFFREARAAAAMTSEHVCRVFDVGTFEGVPYLVMERLEGTDLANLLRQRARLPVHEACDYVIQACAGLAEAHAAKIVHRDLKPGNLFLTSRADGSPLIKVLDFGIAKAPQDGDMDLTGTNAVLGSPAYMSLEHLRSSKLVDMRSDIWSLGVILFEMVAGYRPFAGESVADLALKIAMEPAPRLPEGPAALDDIIQCCLAREPSQRFPDVAALSHALAPWAGDLAHGASPIVDDVSGGSWPPGAPAISLAHPPATMTLSSGAIDAPAPLRAVRSRAGVIGVLAAATVAGTLLAIAVTRGDDASSASPQDREIAAPTDDAPRAPSQPAPSTAVSAPGMAPDAAVAATPTIAPDAAVSEPAADPGIDMEAAGGASQKPAASPPRAAPKPKPRPAKPSTEDLSKSRI